ncbi:MAG: ABC transporter ATP-binding protein [Treponema sp.]|nr:ABC transporter ATP-binding protein [Treponema sp.]
MEKAVILEKVSKKFLTTGESDFSNALTDISFEVAQGSLTIVGGANGSGKSVLMMLIAGLMRPTEGKIIVKSKPGLVFQEASTQILGDTVEEDVAVGPKNQKIPKKQIPAIVESALKKVRLWDKANFPAEFLSGGEKRRLAVASILAMNRDIIIFDEPYANLDYPGVRDVNLLIEQLKKEGKTIILLTHELEKCLALSDHFIILQQGRLVFDGKAEEALQLPLENFAIRNPLAKYQTLQDLVWR